MPSILSGTHPNTLSARAVLPPHEPKPGRPLDEGPEIAIVQFLGPDDDAQMITIIVEPVFSEILTTNGEPHRFPLSHGPCVAIVEFGTGAVVCRVEVDIAKGTCFSVAASSVIIKGRNDGRVGLVPVANIEFPPPPLPIDPAPAPQAVVAMLAGTGTRAAFGRATRTHHRGNVGPGGSVTFPVPAFAKSVTIQRSPSLPIGVAVGAAFGGGAQRDGEYVIPAGAAAPALPLLDIAESVVVRNVGATMLAFVQAQYELAL